MAIDAGEKVTLSATFTDEAGTNTDPSTPVQVTVVDPDGNKVADGATASQSSTGVYEYVLTTGAYGTYLYKFTSADGAVEQGRFYAEPDRTA